MSHVFVAMDSKLGRRVVVKILLPELAGGVSVDRFEREIRLSATLQHPCIVPVLEAGDAEGLPFYTMPFIDGKSLRSRLSNGPLPVPDVVKVLRDVASALACAHASGVVHRDIKPDNVLLSGGYAVVTDFGIAKAVSDARAGPVVGVLTGLGISVGTPAYMAPEQAAADPATDHRADIYSFGVLAYELLVGEPPFAGRSPHATVAAHFTEKPTPLSTRRPDVPGTLAAGVMRCLAKEPAARPQCAADLLEWLTVNPAEHGAVSAGDASAELAVAVLPFTNLSSEPENEYLSDGITEEVMNALSRLGAVRVAARTSSFAFKGKAPDLYTVGQQLKVTAVVEGSVRRAGSRVRISAQLVNIADGFRLWSDRYDRELTDIFTLQDEIAAAVAAALQGMLLSPESGRLAMSVPAVRVQHAPVNADAYELYLRGMHILRNQVVAGATARAIELFERAIAIDPLMAPVHCALGNANLLYAIQAMRPSRDVCPRALSSARRAIELDPMLAEAHTLLGYTSFMFEWDWVMARTHLERALVLDPNDPTTLARSAVFEVSQRHFDLAMAQARRAIYVDPLSPYVRTLAGFTLVAAGAAEDACAVLSEGLELYPHHLTLLRTMAQALMRLGRLDEARVVLERTLDRGRQDPWLLLRLIELNAAEGATSEAELRVEELIQLRTTVRVSRFHIACGVSRVGRLEEAFTWLEEAIRERDVWVALMGVAHEAEVLRLDPRFDGVAHRLGILREG